MYITVATTSGQHHSETAPAEFGAGGDGPQRTLCSSAGIGVCGPRLCLGVRLSPGRPYGVGPRCTRGETQVMTSPTDTHSTDPGASCRMLQALLEGYRGTALIYIAAKLGLHALLADGPQSSDTFCESWSSSARRTHERAAGPNNRGVGPSFLSLWPSSRHGGKGRLDFLYSVRCNFSSSCLPLHESSRGIHRG
jgi:hypothetical protein